MSAILPTMEYREAKLRAEIAVSKYNEAGCRIWCWKPETQGYGVFRHDYTQEKAHRAVWELLVGPIPEDMELDHTCHDHTTCEGGYSCPHRPCIEIEHLELVTHRENVLRGNGMAAVNARRTHCKSGHEFTPENTQLRRLKNGRQARQCRECHRQSERKRYRRLS